MRECIKPVSDSFETLRGAVEGRQHSQGTHHEVSGAMHQTADTMTETSHASTSSNVEEAAATSVEDSMMPDEASAEVHEPPQKADPEPKGKLDEMKLCVDVDSRDQFFNNVGKRKGRSAARRARRESAKIHTQNRVMNAGNAHASLGQVQLQLRPAKEPPHVNQGMSSDVGDLRAWPKSAQGASESVPYVCRNSSTDSINENGLEIFVGDYRGPKDIPLLVSNNPVLSKISKELVANTSTESRAREIGLNRPRLHRCLYTLHHRSEKDLHWSSVENPVKNAEKHKCQFCAACMYRNHYQPQCICFITDRTVVLKDPRPEEMEKQKNYCRF